MVFPGAVMMANIGYSVDIEWKEVETREDLGGLDINYNKYLFSVLSSLHFIHSECKSTCIK